MLMHEELFVTKTFCMEYSQLGKQNLKKGRNKLQKKQILYYIFLDDIFSEIWLTNCSQKSWEIEKNFTKS